MADYYDADFDAVIGEHHSTITCHGPISMALPASPSDGDFVTVNDAATKQFSNNPMTITSGALINMSTDDFVMTDNYGKFTYDAANNNWVYSELTLGE